MVSTRSFRETFNNYSCLTANEREKRRILKSYVPPLLFIFSVQINHGREAGIIRRNSVYKEKIMLERIQVFTRGCSRSIVVEKNLRKAVAKMGLTINIEASDDPLVAKEENITAFPSVKINGELKVDGSFTSSAQFEEILTEYL